MVIRKPVQNLINAKKLTHRHIERVKKPSTRENVQQILKTQIT